MMFPGVLLDSRNNPRIASPGQHPEPETLLRSSSQEKVMTRRLWNMIETLPSSSRGLQNNPSLASGYKASMTDAQMQAPCKAGIRCLGLACFPPRLARPCLAAVRRQPHFLKPSSVTSYSFYLATPVCCAYRRHAVLSMSFLRRPS